MLSLLPISRLIPSLHPQVFAKFFNKKKKMDVLTDGFRSRPSFLNLIASCDAIITAGIAVWTRRYLSHEQINSKKKKKIISAVFFKVRKSAKI